jgi:hypothetical protein
MAKSKKKLMIPFTYYHEEMLDYCRYYYQEGTENSNKMWWDTLENKRVSEPYHPREPIYNSYWYDNYGGNERFNNELEEYPILLKQYESDKKAWDTNVQNGTYIEVDEIIWKENYEFDDTLILTGMSRGRSAANFNLQSETNSKNYNLFMTDIVDMIKNANIFKGKVKGKWTFVKRGQNYGIKLIEQLS